MKRARLLAVILALLTVAALLPSAWAQPVVNYLTIWLGTAGSAAGSLLFYNASNTNTATITGGVTTTSYTLLLPPTKGTAAGQFMRTDGGTPAQLSFAAPNLLTDITGVFTSGGIPYFASTSTIASSAVLGAGQLVFGGGAGAAPATDSDCAFATDTLTCTKLKTGSNTLGLGLLDTGGNHYLQLVYNEDALADRTLNLLLGDAARTITLSGNPTLADWFDQAVKMASTPTFGGATFNGAVTIAGGTTGTLTHTYSGSNPQAIFQNTSAVRAGIVEVHNDQGVESRLDLTSGGSAIGTTLGGVSRNNLQAIFSTGIASTGLLIETFTADPLIFGTGDAERLRFSGAATQPEYSGTDPAVSACGTTPSIATYSSDAAGRVTAGTGVVTSCTVTFAGTWTNAPICHANNETTSQVMTSATSTTVLTITGADFASDSISYLCVGGR